MRVSTIAFANLSRRKGKALFLTAGIALGIGTVVALLSLSASIREEIGAQLDRFGANIVVVPRSNTLMLDYGGVPVPGVTFDVHPLHESDVDQIRQIRYRDRISVVAPKVIATTQVEGQQVLLAGVDFKNELKLRRWWQITGRKPENTDDVLVGYEAARALGIIELVAQVHPTSVSQNEHHVSPAPSSAFTVARQKLALSGRQFDVAGVLVPTGGPEDRMIFASLSRVQAMANRSGQLDAIEVSALCKGCPVEDIVAQIQAKLPHAKVSAVQQAVKAREEMVGRLSRFSLTVALVVLLIGALMIFTTMMGAVVERTREIGVLRAVGFRRTHIIQGLSEEVATVSLLGGFLGWAAGIGSAWIAMPYFTETATRELHPEFLAFAMAAGLTVGVISSVYPALRASRLDPAEAVRSI